MDDAGVLTVTLSTLPFALLWFAMPLRRRRTLDADEHFGGPTIE